MKLTFPLTGADKAIVAIIGAIATSLCVLYAPHYTVIITTVLTALGVYAVPNKVPPPMAMEFKVNPPVSIPSSITGNAPVVVQYTQPVPGSPGWTYDPTPTTPITLPEPPVPPPSPPASIPESEPHYPDGNEQA